MSETTKTKMMRLIWNSQSFLSLSLSLLVVKWLLCEAKIKVGKNEEEKYQKAWI